MNKKLMMFTLTLVTVAMLTTPIVGMVQAGKGQSKLDFKFYLEGTTLGPPQKVWSTEGGTVHIRGMPFVVWPENDTYIEIGVGGSVETIPKEELDYEGIMNINQNPKQGFAVLTVRETITIYTDATKLTERGTLVIYNNGDNPGEGQGNNFVAHGTGEFEGVLVKGKSTVLMGPTRITRSGTVMGWPT